jgi:predicted CoA-substrate-specific enzyme activase
MRLSQDGVSGSPSGASLGIDIGSTNLKACLLRGPRLEWVEVRAHDGDPKRALLGILRERGVNAGVPSLVTGQEARRQFAGAQAIAPVALERALAFLGARVDAVVSVGGEDLVVYRVDGSGRIVNTHAGNKCASGTGEFFAQQLQRMGFGLEAVDAPETAAATPCRLSARCSVFMKSDCTHKLNKGEADKHGIVLSLSQVMAGKVLEFLAKAKVRRGRVLLIGGATRNPHLAAFVRAGLPEVEFVVPEEAPYAEALGAALLAAEQGTPLPEEQQLFGGAQVSYARAEPLSLAQGLVTFLPSRRGTAVAGRSYVLGVDGGSTTTKVALLDKGTREIVASHYGRTLGDPVAALKLCLEEVRGQLRAQLGPEGERAIRIELCATTGSSRELLGVFCETSAVYNEIIAHTAGTTFYDKGVDTLFEIGGQDAKYVCLRNRVPVDYAMNEACSAGTGSFLEESAAGDLDLRHASEIGPVAMAAQAPLKFGEHCSAFINSDIRKASQQGASREDIVAGLVLSIVSNYLNRVVGNRRIGNRILLQGGVAKNPAVPLAFASLLHKPVTVPPDPELMGCVGVALLALQKQAEGLLAAGDWPLERLMANTVRYHRTYRCKSCDNDCPIQILEVGGHKHHFGGRCNKFANLRHRTEGTEAAIDYVEVRRQLYFEKHAAPAPAVPFDGPVVGIPEAFSVHSLYPLYSHFFHQLGVPVKLVCEVDEQGVQKCESSFCYPAELAHGLTESARKQGCDLFFLPHFKAMPSTEKEVHACLCPLTQGLPYYLRTALSLDDRALLRPVLDFTRGTSEPAEALAAIAEKLGRTRAEGRAAFSYALAKQEACFAEGRQIGRQALEDARGAGRPVVALLGRPYNAFAQKANLGIPRKFTTRGATVIPFDFFPIEDESILPNMYWHYGQQDLKAAVLVKQHPDVFACYVSNFSCAPDSFILHYLRWISNSKPFLVLELDSHTADAGLDTRIEAFLDITQGYRRAQLAEEPMLAGRDWDVKLDGADAGVVSHRTGERRSLRDPRVRLIFPSMGRLATQLAASAARSSGIDAIALPPADIHTAARARAVASGKECIPALLVLGAFLEHFASEPPDPDRIHLLFMPLTTGPCRTGQYAIYYQGLFEELGHRNVLVLSLNSDNSYAELGPDFSRRLWVSLVFADYLRDIEGTLRALAREPEEARRVLGAIEREAVEASAQGAEQLLAAIPGFARRLGALVLKKPLSEARKVLVVGEIFVRRDDYSVESLLAGLAEREIVAKITSLSEWIHYLDWDQVRRLRKQWSALPWWQRATGALARQLAWLQVEMVWKVVQERKVVKALSASGLLPPSPHGMQRIMARAGAFSSSELESEAALSPCVAAIGMEEGYDGAAIIAPFACLPGRLIEALYAPWARQRRYPVLSLENDGNPYSPNVMSRIEIFAHNVSRGIRGAEVEAPPPVPAFAQGGPLVALGVGRPGAPPLSQRVH